MKSICAVIIATCLFALPSFAAENQRVPWDRVSGKVGTIDKTTGYKIVEQNLVQPPFLPAWPQVGPKKPRLIKVTLTVQEKLMEIDSGVKVWAFTFNGSVPGPMIVAHVGDVIELTLRNPTTSLMTHNIDFHASTGAMGGAALTLIDPGEEVVLRWKAIKAGAFVYHCAPGGVMVPWHVVKGMNGAVLILPREGLKDADGNPLMYDKAFYVGEQDFYLPQDKDGNYKEYEDSAADFADMVEVMETLTPTHIVFNGRVGGLTDENAMKANVGDTVLIIHAQANRRTMPHLIGGHADYVWPGGSFDNVPLKDQETWHVDGGQAVAAMYTFKQPGTYAYLTHNLIEAFLKGAVALFQVDGEWNRDLMVATRARGQIDGEAEFEPTSCPQYDRIVCRRLKKARQPIESMR